MQQQLQNSRRTIDDRRRTVAAFETLLGLGFGARDAASRLRVGLSTIYRDQQKITQLLSQPLTFSVIEVSILIERLLEKRSHIQDVESVIEFICWLRWPLDDVNRGLACMHCLSAYLYQTFGEIDLASEQNKYVRVLCTRLSTYNLFGLMSGNLTAPDFELYKYLDTALDDVSDLVAIVSYFLSHGQFQDHRRKASLNKVVYLADERGLDGVRPFSGNALRALWNTMGPAAPFWYIARCHSDIKLDLSPMSANFASSVDNLAATTTDLREYLGKCKWVIEALSDNVDPRLLKATSFATFPANLTLIATPITTLSPKVRNLLRDFHKKQR